MKCVDYLKEIRERNIKLENSERIKNEFISKVKAEGEKIDG